MRSNNLADPEKYVYEHNTRSACPRDGMATTCGLLQESVFFESRHQRGAWNRPLGCPGGGEGSFGIALSLASARPSLMGVVLLTCSYNTPSIWLGGKETERFETALPGYTSWSLGNHHYEECAAGLAPLRTRSMSAMDSFRFADISESGTVVTASAFSGISKRPKRDGTDFISCPY